MDAYMRSKFKVHKIVKLAVFFMSLAYFSSNFVSAQQDIVDNIKTALSSSNEIKNYNVSASAISGEVLLIGNVASEAERLTIIKIVHSVPGVVSVRDALIVKPELNSSVYQDDEIEQNIKNSLKKSSLNVPNLSVHQGVVEISGDFNSFREVDETSSIILTTPGVKDLKSNVTVNGMDYMSAFKKEFKKK
jgi:osmotically-inducible protein OsmY